jgi:hypothetical protein
METLILGIFISTVGLAYFIYGKKMDENRFLFVGLAMMIFPYFPGNFAIVLIIGIILAVSPFIIDRYL